MQTWNNLKVSKLWNVKFKLKHWNGIFSSILNGVRSSYEWHHVNNVSQYFKHSQSSLSREKESSSCFESELSSRGGMTRTVHMTILGLFSWKGLPIFLWCHPWGARLLGCCLLSEISCERTLEIISKYRVLSSVIVSLLLLLTSGYWSDQTITLNITFICIHFKVNKLSLKPTHKEERTQYISRVWTPSNEMVTFYIQISLVNIS